MGLNNASVHLDNVRIEQRLCGIMHQSNILFWRFNDISQVVPILTYLDNIDADVLAC